MPAAGEDSLVAWLARELHPGIGDDTATLPAGRLVVTVDSQVEGTHFQPGTDPRLVARRLVLVNLSDLAAAGAQPKAAVLALIAPADFPHRRFIAAVRDTASAYGMPLLGGDVARGPLLAASLTTFGEPNLSRGRPRVTARTLGRPGDQLWVGGTLGEAALGTALLARGARADLRSVYFPTELALTGGRLRTAARRAVLRQLAPTPQLALGSWLASQPRAAAIDISDGLAKDLERLCRASNCGARLELHNLPAAPHHADLARHLGLDPLALVLGGGEDYVLLFALPHSRKPPAEHAAVSIGQLVASPGTQLVTADGLERKLEPVGWDHLSTV